VRSALERAANARRAGDQRHGSELEALALELSQSAVDLVREKQAQGRVDETEQKAQAAETRVMRARALVEQTAARRGRAAERLRELELEKANPTPGAAPPAKPMPDPKTGVAAPKSATPAAKPASEKKAIAPAAKPGKGSSGSP
jgi:colicin import membrane protein